MRHGSESFFILGEGLVTTEVGGRHGEAPDPINESDPVDDQAPPVVAAPVQLAADQAPPFRFIRVGPKGTAIGAGIIRKLGRAMVAEGGGNSGIPAGYTYLGQFIDHDLTMDRTTVMLGEDVRPVDMLQGRSPRLDLDSLYGNGPGDAGSAKFYAADGLHLRTGTTIAVPPDGAKAGHDLPRVGHRGHEEGQARRADRRPAQRREPDRRADPPRDDPLPQPGARQAARVGPGHAAVHAGAQEGQPPLPVADPPRLPAADLRPGRARRRLHQRPQAGRARRDAGLRAGDAGRVLGRGIPPRAQHGAGDLQLEPDLLGIRRGAGVHVPVLRPRAATSVPRSG